MIHVKGRLVMAVLSASLVAAGCSGNRDEFSATATARSSVSSAISSTGAAPSTAASGGTHSLTELAEHPCLVLSHDDTAKLNVLLDASETDDADGKSCQWFVKGGIVGFTPYPAADRTTDPQLQHLTPRQIDGHRALLGSVQHKGNFAGLDIYVAVGTNQSFRLIIPPSGSGAPEPDA